MEKPKPLKAPPMPPYLWRVYEAERRRREGIAGIHAMTRGDVEHKHDVYTIEHGPRGVTVAFHTGVRIRLIATKDQYSGRWKVRLPWGVSIKPEVWRTLARRALWCFVKAREPEKAK